jgi:N6-adenosine-specific RNA methylase IME4
LMGRAMSGDLHDLIKTGRRFPVILADPPWTFETWTEKGKGRSAERHYACMSLDEIKALPVGQLAADNCALFMWTTFPHLQRAHEVLDAWGFRYRTLGFIWVKTTPGSNLVRVGSGAGLHTGTGYWTRANSEPCLLAARGKRQRRSAGVHQVILAPRREHSRKPDEIYARVEELLDGPYLELFARSERPNWTCWGNEVGKFAEKTMVREPGQKVPGSHPRNCRSASSRHDDVVRGTGPPSRANPAEKSE